MMVILSDLDIIMQYLEHLVTLRRLALIATVAGGLAAFITLFHTLKSFAKSVERAHYSELDSMYFNVLKVALEKPYLMNQTAKRTNAQDREYNIYAFMVWNFLEAIHDRCGEHSDHSDLRDTWYRVIEVEHTKHKEWFRHPDNENKFKKCFRDFIRDDGFKTGDIK
jgi:hypothetical protein